MCNLKIRLWLLVLPFILLPQNAWPVLHEITIFPDLAQIIEVTLVKLQPEGKEFQKAIIILPAQADPDTLIVSATDNPNIKIEDQISRQITKQDDARIYDLRKQIEKYKTDKRNLQATLHALDTQIQFWQQQTKSKLKTLADIHNMSAAIGKNMKKAYQEKLDQQPELEKLEKRINELQDELNRTTGKKETAWEISVILSKTQATETSLTYTYALSGCGWLPFYRMEARPKSKNVSFTWEAEIWQSSGQDWRQVFTRLATLKPVLSVAPSDLPPWIIKPRPPIHYRLEKAARAQTAGDVMESANAPDEIAQTPLQTRQSTYAVWQIGKKSIPAGSRQRVKLQDETWPAEFSYLIRPSLHHQAFVMASIRLPEAKEIPQGSAIFMIDGANLGKRTFSLVGKEATLFFGIDPLVTAEKILLAKKSGEKGILTDKQTYLWDWRIEVQNSRNDTALVKIEEPNPQPRDERIKLTMKHDPLPSEKTASSLIWTFDMLAGQKKPILSSVSLEAPADMNLDLGWQR